MVPVATPLTAPSLKPAANSAQGHVLTYDLNGNRTSDTRYGQQVTTQELTGYDESGSPIVTSSYANRTGALFG